MRTHGSGAAAELVTWALTVSAVRKGPAAVTRQEGTCNLGRAHWKPSPRTLWQQAAQQTRHLRCLARSGDGGPPTPAGAEHPELRSRPKAELLSQLPPPSLPSGSR